MPRPITSMLLRPALVCCLALAFALAGCETLEEEGSAPSTAAPDSLAAASTRSAKPTVPRAAPAPSAAAAGAQARQPPEDATFTRFLAELRDAVARRDATRLAMMMTPQFGYSIEPVLQGEGVFEFWDKNNLWLELELVLREKFQFHEGFLVAPPEFALRPEGYRGYRAGITKKKGKWRFAYFVSG